MKLEYSLKKSPEFIFEYLTDMKKFVTVHPIIYKIEEQGENNYLIFEKIKNPVYPK